MGRVVGGGGGGGGGEAPPAALCTGANKVIKKWESTQPMAVVVSHFWLEKRYVLNKGAREAFEIFSVPAAASFILSERSELIKEDRK